MIDRFRQILQAFWYYLNMNLMIKANKICIYLAYGFSSQINALQALTYLNLYKTILLLDFITHTTFQPIDLSYNCPSLPYSKPHHCPMTYFTKGRKLSGMNYFKSICFLFLKPPSVSLLCSLPTPPPFFLVKSTRIFYLIDAFYGQWLF